jgi:nucleotidyltransferase/DNA polymerase involved in DNA repair
MLVTEHSSLEPRPIFLPSLNPLGVQTEEPIWEAVVKCPEGIYLKRDFRWYEVLSRLMYEVLSEYSPCVEYYSIDLLFCPAP